MKKILSLVIIMGLIMIFVGCAAETVDNSQTKITEQIMQESNNRIGMPDINNFYEKSLLKDLYELRDDSELICYAYTRSEMSGKYIYEGMCIGYGLPYAVQYSNPQKVVQGDHELGYDMAGRINYPMLKPQAEPNGLFQPDALSATWLIMINEDGEREPAYYEPTIVVRQSKIRKELCEEWSFTEDY